MVTSVSCNHAKQNGILWENSLGCKNYPLSREPSSEVSFACMELNLIICIMELWGKCCYGDTFLKIDPVSIRSVWKWHHYV